MPYKVKKRNKMFSEYLQQHDNDTFEALGMEELQEIEQGNPELYTDLMSKKYADFAAVKKAVAGARCPGCVAAAVGRKKHEVTLQGGNDNDMLLIEKGKGKQKKKKGMVKHWGKMMKKA